MILSSENVTISLLGYRNEYRRTATTATATTPRKMVFFQPINSSVPPLFSQRYKTIGGNTSYLLRDESLSLASSDFDLIREKLNILDHMSQSTKAKPSNQNKARQQTATKRKGKVGFCHLEVCQIAVADDLPPELLQVYPPIIGGRRAGRTEDQEEFH
jgi:hypothetical protein